MLKILLMNIFGSTRTKLILGLVENILFFCIFLECWV